MAPSASANIRQVVRRLSVIGLSLVAATASAQINEQDRLERCANNAERAGQIEAQLKQTWGEQRVEKARAVLPVLRSLAVNINTLAQTVDYKQAAATRPAPNIPVIDPNWATEQRRAEWERDQARREAQAASQQLDAVLNEFLQYAASVGVRCAVKDAGCPTRALNLIYKEIDSSTANRATLERQLANHRTNLIALGCSQATDREAPSPGNISDTTGLWSGTYHDRERANTINLSGGAGSLAGSTQYRSGDSHNDGSISGCRPAGNGAFDCNFQYQYADKVKSGEVTGTVTLSRSGRCGLSGDWKIVSAVFHANDDGRPYESFSMRAGGGGHGSYTRDGCSE